MRKKVAIIIDGNFMRRRVLSDQYQELSEKSFFWSADNIRKYSLQHIKKDEELFRIYFYDSDTCTGNAINPISKHQSILQNSESAQHRERLFRDLRKTPGFALRLGIGKWTKRWQIKYSSQESIMRSQPQNDYVLRPGDLEPKIEQKAVDMKIGLDIALLAIKKIVDRIVVIAGDEDFVPALKFARREGLLVTVDSMGGHVNERLKEHCDTFLFHRGLVKNKHKKAHSQAPTTNDS